MKKIEKVAIIGMGALGILYGTQSMDAGHPVEFVMNAERVAKYKDRTFYKNGKPYKMPVQDCATATPADLVMVAVKYNGLASAIADMKRCIGENTIIMSVMNGIDSEERIAEVYGMERMIYTVAQGMDAMKAGEELKFTQMGELHIGARYDSQQKNVDAVEAYFKEISMPYIREEDIMYRLWSKFMLNVGINQCCMAFNTTYNGCLTKGEANRTMISAMREVIALANSEGISLTEKDLNAYVDILKTLSPDGIPSMQQDGVAHRPSEIEMFAGTVIRRAKVQGLLVPVNEFLYDRVHEIEASWK